MYALRAQSQGLIPPPSYAPGNRRESEAGRHSASAPQAAPPRRQRRREPPQAGAASAAQANVEEHGARNAGRRRRKPTRKGEIARAVAGGVGGHEREIASFLARDCGFATFPGGAFARKLRPGAQNAWSASIGYKHKAARRLKNVANPQSLARIRAFSRPTALARREPGGRGAGRAEMTGRGGRRDGDDGREVEGNLRAPEDGRARAPSARERRSTQPSAEGGGATGGRPSAEGTSTRRPAAHEERPPSPTARPRTGRPPPPAPARRRRSRAPAAGGSRAVAP